MKQNMKKLTQPRFLYPTLRRTAVRALIGAAFMVLWGIFSKTSDIFNPFNLTAPVVGAVFVLIAWFNYLAIDGFKLSHLPRRDKEPKGKKNRGGMLSYMDEDEVSDLDELSDDENRISRFTANTFCAILFFLVSIFGSVFSA